MKAALEGLGKLDLSGKAGGGHASCSARSAADIVAAIKKAGGPNLDRRTVQLPKGHIKSLGTHPVSVRLHPGRDAAVTVNVVAGRNYSCVNSPA